ncbi:aspartate aminotransferase family protein [Candidatus Oscillochloris fontis]|uniref:aspartate aminotransferase family protein n=1 Tax=Candidatus Oscillochloris fontis TaxID=2496868 RepID=UPI00101DE537|nr:aspartate aminotransferase family protein [Candidatus Oscillochloris fontis]
MPADTAAAVIQADREYILQTYIRPDTVIERGEGVYLYDTEGREYLDFVAGIAVNALGYGDPDVTAAINQQATKLIHTSNLFHNAPATDLARMLVTSSDAFDKVFFSNSGAEAVEGAIKFARRYAREYYGEGKTTIIACDGAFHGRSMGAVAITAREKYREPFMPVMPGVRFANYNDVASLEAAMGADVCALFIEPIQGEGGLRVASDEFLAAARALCNQHHALLVLDEIQCGMGRSGSLWAHQPSGVRPDMMTVAKPLAGGMPIGAVLLNQRIADTIHPGDHGTTFGGNPLVTAVAGAVFNKINTPEFLAHVCEVSNYLGESLQDLAAAMPNQIREIRGRGLMRGFQLNGSAADARTAAQHQGLLVGTSGEDVIRLLPPLIITNAHVDAALEKLRAALQ